MQVRRLRPVLSRRLPQLPATCAVCPLGDQVHFTGDPSWARSAEDRWGWCGVAAHHDGHVVGYALITPALNVPKAHPMTMWPRTPDSAVLVSLRVLDQGQHNAVARQLVQAVAARLVDRVSCLEAIGTSAAARCTTPATAWLASVGFAADDSPRPPGCPADQDRMRMDFSTTSRWAPGLRTVWGAVTDWVHQPSPGAEPARATPATSSVCPVATR